mmetsp:Transcript_59470/g.98605  ORF Transcript_59470/g.98605 Transcript_59470/m.98605 type:complete len:96 (+) Transcript_59470:245-532(+)
MVSHPLTALLGSQGKRQSLAQALHSQTVALLLLSQAVQPVQPQASVPSEPAKLHSQLRALQWAESLQQLGRLGELEVLPRVRLATFALRSPGSGH